MIRVTYNDSVYTIHELSEMSGIAPATLRDRLRRGHTVEEAIKVTPVTDSVREFCEASWWKDWIGTSTSSLYENYWQWCMSHGYSPIHIKGFTRQLMKIYPNLKVVPQLKDGMYYRMIRER